MSRIYRSKDGTDNTAEMLKTEKALKTIGITTYDEYGNVKKFTDLMAELNNVWDDLSEKKQIYIADALGGARQISQVLGIAKNMDRVNELTDIGRNQSEGAAMKAQLEWADSIEGKLEHLKGVVEVFWQHFLDSDVLKTGIDLLSAFVQGLDSLSSKMGSVTMVVGGLTTAFLLLTNNPLSTFSKKLATNMLQLNSFSGGIKATTEKLVQMGVAEGTNIATMTKSQKAVAGLKGVFSALKLETIGTTLAVGALQVALSVGLAAALMAVVSGIQYVYKNFINVTDAMDEASGLIDEISKRNTDFSQVDKDIDKYAELEKQLSSIQLSTEKRNELTSELDSITESLINREGKYKEILEDETTPLDERVQKLKEELKTEQELQDLKDRTDLQKRLPDQSKAEKMRDDLQKYLEEWNKVKEAQRIIYNTEGDTQEKRNAQAFLGLDDGAKKAKRLETNIGELTLGLDEFNKGCELSDKKQWGLNISTVELDKNSQALAEKFKESTSAKKEETKAIEENTDAKKQNADIAAFQDVPAEESGKQYNEALKNIVKLEEFQKSINEEKQITRDIGIEILDMYPEAAIKINDTASAQAFLNEKIQEQKDAANAAFETMIGNDEAYYEQKMVNNEVFRQAVADFANQFIQLNGEALNIDLKNYGTYNELKIDMMGQMNFALSSWLSNFVGGQADSYVIELQNCKTWAEKKKLILEKLANGIKAVNTALTTSDESYLTDEKKAELEGERKRLEEAQAMIEGLDLDFSGMDSISLQKPKFPSVGGGKSPSISSKSTKQDVADLEDLTEEFYNLKNEIDRVTDALDYNDEAMKNAYGAEKRRLMEEKISLLQQEMNLQKQLTNEQEKRKDELAAELRRQGFTMDAYGDIQNRNELVEYYRKKANAKTGDAKKKAQDDLKDLIKKTEEYTKLVRDEIPKTALEYKKLSNEIKAAYREQAELVRDQEKQIYDVVKYYAEKKTEAKKKAIEDARDAVDKQYEEDEYDQNLEDARTELAKIKAEMNKYANDTSRKGKAKYNELMEQYKEQEKAMTDMINEHAKDKMEDRFDEELDLLDKELEDFLKPENINQIIDEAIRTGLVNVFGEVVKVDEAMTKWISETEVGLINQNMLMQDLVENLQTVESLYKNINNISSGAGLGMYTINNDILKDLYPKDVSNTEPVVINGGDIIIQGNVTPEVMQDLEAVKNRWKTEVIKDVTKAIRG